ncbi:MAG: glycoside hydrolase family 3 N-terminal domain-containing protein [Dehalococcoidia bacterium]|nr:glycoside hydrolase family 3 N-terminal domain-containing protein [Dehalococcoidia bacterium]
MKGTKGLPAYKDARRPLAERVADLLGRMTLDEKVAQLGAAWSTSLLEDGSFAEAKARELIGHGIGHITRIGGATTLRPEETAQLANEIQRFLREQTRLGIPAIVHEESCAGYTARDATCFPQAIGLAATWEPELIEEMTSVIRLQMRSVGAHQALAPVLDVVRDPRWGRTEETFGEDPHLISRIGVAYVKGLQGDDWKSGVVATGKHFIGYGASEGGLNWAPAHIPRRELLEVYAAPFEAAIREARLGSMMNAYHELDGVPCGASRELLEALLRDELGFEGVVVSDYTTLPMLVHYHHLTDSKPEAAALALEAGIDVELPELRYYGGPLREALEQGRIAMSLIDRSVARVLRMKFRLGLFEDPYVHAPSAAAVFDTTEQRQLALRVAEKSIVLLKNEGGLLPLSRSLKRIAVIGPSADDIRLMQGDYHYPSHLEITFAPAAAGAEPRPDAAPPDLSQHFVPMVSILQGIRNIAPDAEVFHAKGCDVLDPSTAGFAAAVEATLRAEVAVVCVGDRSGLVRGCTSGESSDRADLGLPGAQQALIEAVAATGRPVVVVLTVGRPAAVPWIAENVAAVLVAWLPGEEGGNAVARVLFGETAPGGKLPITFPRSVGQVPVYYGHKPSGGRTMWQGDYVDLPVSPLYAFGHGLSYTSFEYSGLKVSPEVVAPDGRVAISVDITNSGIRAGEEVVQLYLRDVVATVTRPVKQLAGFKRLALAPGETRTVTFRVDPRALAFYDRAMEFVVEPGDVEVMVGSSSEDIRLMGRFRIGGARRPVRGGEVAPTGVDVV